MVPATVDIGKKYLILVAFCIYKLHVNINGTDNQLLCLYKNKYRLLLLFMMIPRLVLK